MLSALCAHPGRIRPTVYSRPKAPNLFKKEVILRFRSSCSPSISPMISCTKEIMSSSCSVYCCRCTYRWHETLCIPNFKIGYVVDGTLSSILRAQHVNTSKHGARCKQAICPVLPLRLFMWHKLPACLVQSGSIVERTYMLRDTILGIAPKSMHFKHVQWLFECRYRLKPQVEGEATILPSLDAMMTIVRIC